MTTRLLRACRSRLVTIGQRLLRIHSPSRHTLGTCWCGAPSPVLDTIDATAATLTLIAGALATVDDRTAPRTSLWPVMGPPVGIAPPPPLLDAAVAEVLADLRTRPPVTFLPDADGGTLVERPTNPPEPGAVVATYRPTYRLDRTALAEGLDLALAAGRPGTVPPTTDSARRVDAQAPDLLQHDGGVASATDGIPRADADSPG